MEIGNLLFGHGVHGAYEVSRSLQESVEWDFLLRRTKSDFYGYTIDEKHRNSMGGYENDTFVINPYWWGDPDDDRSNAPNFLYKPTGFEIRWYKYPFRDSDMNIKLQMSQIRRIFEKCIKSIKE